MQNRVINIISKRLPARRYQQVMAVLGAFSITWLFAVPGAVAQPAEFSSATGILEIPVIEINGQRSVREAELLLEDADNGEFRLVDYAFTEDEALGIQHRMLGYGESVELTEDRTL